MPLDRFNGKGSSTPVASKRPYISSPIETRDRKPLPSPPTTHSDIEASSDYSRGETTNRSQHTSYNLPQYPPNPRASNLKDQNSRPASSVYREFIQNSPFRETRQTSSTPGFIGNFSSGPYSGNQYSETRNTEEDLKSSVLEEIPIDTNFSPGAQVPEATTPSTEMAESKTKRKPNTRVATVLYALGVVAVLIAAVALVLTVHPKADNVEHQSQSSTASDTPNATSNIPPISSPTLTRATDDDSRSNVDVTSVITVTSDLDTSDTPSPKPTTTSTLESSSVLSSSSFSVNSSSRSSNFMQSTMMGDTLVERSGYLGQRGGLLPYDDMALALDLDRREDPENCQDTITTSTTTLTTTITSTIRTFTPVASSIGSNSASPQLSEPKPAETVPECITNTIFHTDGLPHFTASSHDSTILNTESPSVTADSTPSPDMTPSPTTSSVAQSLGEDTAVVSASSIAQARRLVAPLIWSIPRHIRRFVPWVPGSDGQTQQNRNLFPSLTAMPTTTTTHNNGGNSEGTQLLGTASSNAAARRQGKLWTMMSKSTSASPSRTLERRQAPSLSPSSLASGVKWTPWQAYSQVERQLTQMCYTVETYLNATLVPVADQTPEDFKMGKALNENVCNSLVQDFPQITEGGKCDKTDVWKSLVRKVEELCGMFRDGEGKTLVQSVELLCKITESSKEDVDACREEGEGAAGGTSGTSTMSAASLTDTFDGGPSTAREESAAGADAKSTADSDQANSISPSISLQHNAVQNASPRPTGSSATPVTLINEPPPITSIASLLTTSILPTPPISGNTPVSAPPTPASGLGVLPPHPSYNPPDDWTISMLTYSTQAANYSSLRTMPSNAVGTPPVYTGPHLSRDWENEYPFPIPTGYVAPNIVPADPNVGQLTYFNAGLGACGTPNMVSNELAVAISWELYDMSRLIGGSVLEKGWKSEGVNPDGKLSDWPHDKASSALCNQGIRMWLADDKGKKLVEQDFVVRDRCTACNVSDLDIQASIYSKYWDGLGKGRIQVIWEWMQEAPTGVPG